jgi:hypothetical protein
MTENYQRAEVERKMSRLNEQLERRFGVSLDLDSVDYLHMVEAHYRSNRDFIIARYGLAESLAREDYAKAVLISEAIALFLREIAPTRTKPRTRSRKEQK